MEKHRFSELKLAGPATQFTRKHRRTKSADFRREQGSHLHAEPSISVASSKLTSTEPATKDIEDPLRLRYGYDDIGVHRWLRHVAKKPQKHITQIARNSGQMSNQSTLPTGRGSAPAHIPQYLTSEQQQSSGSAGSQDSVRTQIPLPYHLPNNAPHGQNQGDYMNSWGTPDLSGTATFENARGGASGSSRSLNPNSAPYVPPGYPPGFQSYGSQYGPGASTASPFQQPAQLGGMSHHPTNGFTQGHNSAGVHLPGQYGNAPAMNPYAHFGAPAGMDRYDPYHSSTVHPADPYGASNGVSPAMSHASLAPAQPIYQSLPYGPGTGAGINPPTEYAAHNGYQGGSQGWANMNSSRAQYQPPVPMSINPANVHRGKPTYVNNGRKSFGQPGLGHGHPSSNLATAPVMSAQSSYGNGQPTSHLATAPHLGAGGKESVKPMSTHKEKFGAPVIPPSQAAAARLDASPTKSVIGGVRTRTASPERRPVVPEGAPTPGPKNQPLDLEFSSEPRNTATPTLRSRRGQTITNAVTSPRKQITSNWLDNIPNLANIDPNGSAVPAQSPPKMLSLLGSGAGDSKTLSTINENDPFIGPPRPRATTVYNNPFAPKPQASPYTGGNNLIGPPSGPSPHLRALTGDGTRLPTLEEALDPSNFPFVELCRQAKQENFGVIKIKNIPYGVTRPEILAFLGRNARIINEQEYEPVHIVMERVTSKTLDCYVEFTNLNEAVNAVNRFDSNRAGNRGGRLGSRHVDVELASQEQLMKDLFPKAKNVRWEGSRPIIIPKDPRDMYNSGFQGFISNEELVMLVKHVEAPQRSPFSKECPQRPFECLISTLMKYPWYVCEHISMHERHMLHRATIELIKLLQERIDSGADPVNLNNQLFKRVWRAALKCPGFTPVMKDDVVFLCGIDDRTALELGVAPYAVWWKPLFTIGHKPGIPTDTLMWYIALIREHLDRKKAYESLAERAARNAGNEMPKLFGDLDKYIVRQDEWWTKSLAKAAAYEWAAIEQILREILTPALEG